MNKLWTEDEIREQTYQVFRDNGITDNLPELIFSHSQGSVAKPHKNVIRHPIWMLTGKYRYREDKIIDVPEHWLVYEYGLMIIIHEVCHFLHHFEDLDDYKKHTHGPLFKQIELRELRRYDLAVIHSRAYANTIYIESTGEIVWCRDKKQIGSIRPKPSGAQGYLFNLSNKRQEK